MDYNPAIDSGRLNETISIQLNGIVFHNLQEAADFDAQHRTQHA
jgi:hypothetical protein